MKGILSVDGFRHKRQSLVRAVRTVDSSIQIRSKLVHMRIVYCAGTAFQDSFYGIYGNKVSFLKGRRRKGFIQQQKAATGRGGINGLETLAFFTETPEIQRAVFIRGEMREHEICR